MLTPVKEKRESKKKSSRKSEKLMVFSRIPKNDLAMIVVMI